MSSHVHVCGQKADTLIKWCDTIQPYVEAFRFLSRDSILTRDIDIANMSVCLSVTFRYQMKRLNISS